MAELAAVVPTSRLHFGAVSFVFDRIDFEHGGTI